MTILRLTKSISRSPLRLAIFLIPIVFACFALSPTAQAVSPAPDGGYPNFTTAEGTKALQSLTTGSANTAVGWFSLFSNAGGSFNTATGAGTLLFNTAGENTAFGTAALLFNTTGTDNTAVGVAALLNNTEGHDNTATGLNALYSNTSGSQNTAVGAGALLANAGALGEGDSNTATGFEALHTNTTGNRNTANGASALVNSRGSFNTAVGESALFMETSGSGNTALGTGAGSGVTTASNVICIGIDGNNVSNSCYIGQIFNATSSGGTAVFINSNGRLGTMTSSKRFKQDIKPMDNASEALYSLKPVSFRYKKEFDEAGTSQLGLVAEDVEKIAPELVVRDKDGKAYAFAMTK